MTYWLKVQFKSNERSFSTNYKPLAVHQPPDDDLAKDWARGMRDGLGDDYQVTLMRDDTAIPLTP